MKQSDPLLFRQQALIDGEWRDAADGARFAIHNPATAETVGHAPRCGAADAERAVAAAHAAFAGWRATPAKTRAQLLRRWFELMLAHRDDLAAIMVREQGKPLAEARGEVLYAASFIEWFAEEGKRIYGDTIQSPWADKRIVVIKQALGVDCVATGVVDFATFRSQIADRKMKGMFRTGWQMDYPSIENFLAPIYKTGASSNDGDYSNPEFDKLLVQAAAATDEAEANKLYQQAEALLAQDMPAIPMWYGKTTMGWSDKVTGVKITAFGTIDFTSVSLK